MPTGNELTIGFIGNPNCGKTTLFNAYTGANLKVANWPGVTVEKVEGAIKDHDQTIRLVDLPGTYSLTSYTMEEIVSRQFILSDEVDVIINVVDASALERSLYLTMQLLELKKPVVLALNMMDIVQKRGMEIDLHRLPEMLGIPVIPVSARKRMGLDILIHTAIHHKDVKGPEILIHNHRETDSRLKKLHSEYAMVYSDDIEEKIADVTKSLSQQYPELINKRWYAIKLLEGDREISEKYPVKLPDMPEGNCEAEIINQKYDFIDEIIHEVMIHKQRQDKFTEKLDRAFTHRIWGIPIFLGIMAVVFFLTFFVGDLIKSLFEMGLGWLSDSVQSGLQSVNASGWLISLVVDGIIGGVGTIITFLPNIFILFLALAFLEDSGYMARVAYVMEGIMSKLGLSGKAFIPMLLGFGCTVPAIMASRALENKRDRFKVMLVTPFMSCNARLTIYILFAEMFFARYAMPVAFAMYLLGILVAIAVSAVVHLIDRKKKRQLSYHRTSRVQNARRPHGGDLRLGKSKRLSRQGGNHDFRGHHSDMGTAASGAYGLCVGYGTEFRRIRRQIPGARVRAHRTGILADSSGAYSRHIRQRSGGVQLRHFVRHCQHRQRRRHERVCRGSRRSGVRRAKRVVSHGFLPFVHSMCRSDSYYSQGVQKLEVDDFYRSFPAGGGMGGDVCRLPGGTAYCVTEEL